MILLAVTAPACSRGPSDVAPTFSLPTVGPPSAGEMVEVASGTIVQRVETRGRIVATQEALLVFPLGGSLRAMHVLPGDQVTAGTVVAELDALAARREQIEREYALSFAELELAQAEALAEAQMDLAEAEVSTARRNVDTTQREYERTVLDGEVAVQRAGRPLARGVWCDWCDTDVQQARLKGDAANALALARVEAAQAYLSATIVSQGVVSATYGLGVDIARERLERARALLALASEEFAATQLKAPFSGVIISVDKQVGDQMQAYEPVGSIADPAELWAVATIPEELMLLVAVGQPAAVRLDAYPDQTYGAAVVQISQQAIVWQGRSAYVVTVSFDEGQDVPATIRMGADIAIGVRSVTDILVIPQRAVLTIGGRDFVERVGDDGAVERVEIVTGISDDGQIEVVAGLEEGQVIRVP